MPLDPMMSGAILGSFKNMVDECRQKNASGEDFNKLCETYARLEQLAEEHSDMNAFNGQVMQENLYGLISDYYGRVLSAEAKANLSSDTGDYDDAKLLKMSVDALKQAIESIRKNYADAIQLAKTENAAEHTKAGLDYLERNTDKNLFNATGGMENLRTEADKSLENTLQNTPNAYDNSVEVEVLQNPETIIKPIQDVIDLGEQLGMTLPKFLRIQIERGLDKAMDGTVALRQSLLVEKEFIMVNPDSPYQIQMIDKKISGFDMLASANKFGIPNAKEFSYLRDDIEREFKPKTIEWNKIKKMWDAMLFDLSFWSLSYLDYAPYLKPWCLSRDPKAATIETQNIRPGIFKEREKLFKKYFGLSFHDAFKHPSFEWDVKYHYVGYSQEFVEFMIAKLYPACEPFQHLSPELISERAAFHKKDRNAVDREGNPESHLPAERNRLFYNAKFGEGRHESKYGMHEVSESKAAPWNWNTFKYS